METLSNLGIVFLIFTILLLIVTLILGSNLNSYKKKYKKEAVIAKSRQIQLEKVHRTYEETIKKRTLHNYEIVFLLHNGEVAKNVKCVPLLDKTNNKVIGTKATIRKKVEGKFTDIPVNVRLIKNDTYLINK